MSDICADFRVLCAEMLQAFDDYFRCPIDASFKPFAAARAALAAEPVGEGPTDEDLDEFALFWWGSDLDERTVTDVIESTSMTAFARDILAPWGRPATPPAPEPGEVGSLAVLLTLGSDCGGGAKLSPQQCRRAATLLKQQAAPAPVVVPVAEISDSAVLAITESLGMIAMECAVQAAKRDPEGAHRKMVQEARGAILKWLNALPLPQAGEGEV